MPNTLDANGLTLSTREELVAAMTADYQEIYGNDINLDQDSPDGQIMNIFIQAVLDLEDLVAQVYSSMDPDNAIGKTLDQRVALNGIERRGGTYSETNITMVNSQSVTLTGLNGVEAGAESDAFTISDDAGTQWYLKETQEGLVAGTHVLAFRAQNPGAVLTVPNTITVFVTVVLGVDSVNNPTTYSLLGENEEADSALKIRRRGSVSLPSQGYLVSLQAALENLSGVTYARVYENVTSVTDGDGIPGHSIWVIVEGTATDEEVANVIYTYRNAGAGLKTGTHSYTIIQVNSVPFIVTWDEVETEDLFIKFTATSLDGISPPDVAAIRAGLITDFAPGVYEEVNINKLATAVQSIDPNTLVTDAGFGTSSGGPFTSTLTPSAKNMRFVLDQANIIIIPIVLSPASKTLAALASQQFTAYGGFGTYTWSMQAAPSGGSVDSNGLYTAGATPSVTDVVKVTDSLSNFTTANITVT